MPPRAKAAGIAAMAAAFAISVAMAVPAALLALQAAVLCGVGAFLLSRPSRPPAGRRREEGGRE